MTDTAGLIAELEHMAKLLGVGSIDIPALLRRAAAALAAQVQEIEQKELVIRQVTLQATDLSVRLGKEKDRAEAAETEVKRITQMAIGEIYAEWERRVETSEARVRELERVAFQAQEMAKEQCAHAKSAETRVRELLSKRPVAFRVLKPNGDWYVTQDEHEASDIADGRDYQGLYTRGSQ